MANALWPQRGYPFSPAFLKSLKTDYGGETQSLDFASDVAGACRAINQWVGQQTRGKIPEIVSPGVIPPLTQMVLTNAIYFKGRWDSPFEETATRTDTFRAEGALFGRKVPVPMMEQSSEFDYVRDGGIQVLELPYQGKTLSMVILLPKRRNGLPALEKSLSAGRLTEWQQRLRRQEVRVFLPRFKMLWGDALARILMQMGMPDAFSGQRANLSGMVVSGEGAPKENLFIDEVIHKAFVETNEEGTEAAAVTAVFGVCTGLPEPVPVFRVDRHFLFLIRHNRTGAILFMGRVTDPSAFN